MNEFLTQLAAADIVDGPSVKAIFKGIQKGNKLKGQQVYMPVRVALTGNQHGPELVEMIPLLGKERTKKRIMASLTKAGINLEGK